MKLDCGGASISRAALSDDVNYLKMLPDKTICTNKPRSCGRISCSWTTAIVICNTDNNDFNPRPCNTFGDYAKWILDHCSGGGRDGSFYGKLTDDGDKLMVKVGRARC